MKKKKIRQVIRKVEASLSWPLRIIKQGDTLEIISDADSKTHTINWPVIDTAAGEVRDIEYLHELGHAFLAERNPVFTVHRFASEEENINELLHVLSGPVRMTADWFVDDLMIQWAKEEELKEIEEHFLIVRRLLNNNASMGDIRLASIIVAQGIRYLNAKFPVEGALKKAVGCFLKVDPSRPTVDNFSTLFNLLLRDSGLLATWDDKDIAWDISPYQATRG